MVATVLVLRVAHPDHREQPLSLVVCRSQGRSPWYLLTTEAIETDEQAWQVVFVYVRRWQIELSWKYEKSELAFQSPRVYAGQAREKLLLLATLAYAFLTLLCWRSAMNCCGSGCCATLLTARASTAELPSCRSRACAAPRDRLWQDLPPNFASVGAPPKQVQITPVA